MQGFLAPEEGLWSVAIGWDDQWPADWRHAQPEATTTEGDWTILTGRLALPGGDLLLRDAYRVEGDTVRGVRRFTWTGAEPLAPVTLSVRWIVPDAAGAKLVLPGISYAGNPSGARMGGCVPVQTMAPGERSFYEEHRYPLPFASLEKAGRGAALHTLPSLVPGANVPDLWWSLGLIAGERDVELALLSGPCASNGRNAVVKARQSEFVAYPGTWLTLRPGTVIEKTFFLEAYSVATSGTGFFAPLTASIARHAPFSCDGLPTARQILADKWRYARSRWRDFGDVAGFSMYPAEYPGTHFVMGWCGQAEAPGYAALVLEKALGDPDAVAMATRSLDFLATAPRTDDGFLLHYQVETGRWSDADFVSQGQALESITRAIDVGRRRGDIATGVWEEFAGDAGARHALRLLRPDWHPVSTSEGFLIAPLLRASRLLGAGNLADAALRAADHYAERHLSLDEPYWGGTLDARCEDKEGAFAAFQGFLAAYDHTGQTKYLTWAEHAMHVALSYTVVWDIDLPPGRLRDHGLKTRGWTVVSAQNQHLDVFGVLYAPDIYRMGEHLGRDDLKKLAIVMYRSCGQLIDPWGSQGEQIQQTNFAQHGDLSDVYRMRGGYSEGWTVFWITAHFLHAAARFEEAGVALEGGEG